MKKNQISRQLIPIEKSTEDIEYLVERLNESLKKDQYFFTTGLGEKSPEKMTKQELIEERNALLFNLKRVNNQFIYEFLNRIEREVSMLGRTGPLKALRVEGITRRQWIRLAMLRFNGVEDSKRMPHKKIANLPYYPIEEPKSRGKEFISKIKVHLIEVVETHIKRKLSQKHRDIVLRIEPKSIRDMLKSLNY